MLVDETQPSVRRHSKSAFGRTCAGGLRSKVGPNGSMRPSASIPHPATENSSTTAFAEREHEFAQKLLDSFASELAILDASGNVVLASAAWRSRAEQADLENDPEADAGNAMAFLSTDARTAELIVGAVANILSGRSDEAKLNFVTKTAGAARHYRLRVAPVSVGQSRGAMINREDVTEQFELQSDKRLLAKQLMQSEDKERRRIAREMHDSTLQDLVAIGLNLKRLQHLADDEIAQDVFGEIRSILTRTQQDVRTLSYLLHPPLLEEGGLRLALSSLIQGLSSRMSMRIDFLCDCCDEYVRLPMDIEVALYRVAQEALINVHKHASATHAQVRCCRDADHLILTVEDNGIGYCGPNRCHVGSGVGVQGMRARLRQLGGQLTLSNLRQGTRLRAVVPVDWAAV